MNIIKPNVFCLFNGRVLGLATGHTFATVAWCHGDEFFNNVSGNKFSWTAADGNEYTDHKGLFRRPSEEQIKHLLDQEPNKKLKEIALKEGYITADSTVGTERV
jgi:hypothetical protein